MVGLSPYLRHWVRHVQALKEDRSVDNEESFQVVVGLDGSDESRAGLGWAVSEARLRRGKGPGRDRVAASRSTSRALLLWHCQMARTLTGHGSSDSRLEDAATLTNRHPTRWRDGNRSGPIAQQMTKRRKEGDGSR